MNFIDASVVGKSAGGVDLALKGFESLPPLGVRINPATVEVGAKVTLGVRPEHARVVGDGATGGAIPLKVAQVEQLGGHGFVHCTLPDSTDSMVVQFEGQNVIHAGSEVFVAIPPESCHVFSCAPGAPVIAKAA